MKDQLVEIFRNFLLVRKSDKIEEKVEDFKLIISRKYRKDVVYDEIIDFFDIMEGKTTRWQSFAKYIEITFPKKKFPNILEIGCGPVGDLTTILNEKGYQSTGIDPRVDSVKNLKLIKEEFHYLYTDVSTYNLLVGLEPCNATEHIVRSSIQNNIPCVISLCGTTHDGIDGRKFSQREQWYEYLLSLTMSRGVLEKKTILGKTHMILKTL